MGTAIRVDGELAGRDVQRAHDSQNLSECGRLTVVPFRCTMPSPATVPCVSWTARSWLACFRQNRTRAPHGHIAATRRPGKHETFSPETRFYLFHLGDDRWDPHLTVIVRLVKQLHTPQQGGPRRYPEELAVRIRTIARRTITKRKSSTVRTIPTRLTSRVQTIERQIQAGPTVIAKEIIATNSGELVWHQVKTWEQAQRPVPPALNPFSPAPAASRECVRYGCRFAGRVGRRNLFFPCRGFLSYPYC